MQFFCAPCLIAWVILYCSGTCRSVHINVNISIWLQKKITIIITIMTNALPAVTVQINIFCRYIKNQNNFVEISLFFVLLFFFHWSKFYRYVDSCVQLAEKKHQRKQSFEWSFWDIVRFIHVLLIVQQHQNLPHKRFLVLTDKKKSNQLIKSLL